MLAVVFGVYFLGELTFCSKALRYNSFFTHYNNYTCHYA